MVGIYPFRNYRVLFTPLVGVNTYGSVVDVTQDIDLTDFIKSFGKIKKEIDNGDYDIGIFTFSDITLDVINYDRRFNGPEDPQSIFKFTRDRCKVEIVFFDEDGNDSTRFKGLINDDATRVDFTRNTIRFRILSLDSIFRQVEVPQGSIVEGDLFSTAIKKILNVPEVTTTLTYDAANVNVGLDLQIDDGDVFSSTSARNSLEDLLLASNSIMFVDNNDTIFVKARRESVNVFELFGHGDILGRENVLQIKDYNNGLHRAFSSALVNTNGLSTSDAWVAQYGFRQKTASFAFITTESKETLIADKIVEEFKVPKTELEIEVTTKSVENIEL